MRRALFPGEAFQESTGSISITPSEINVNFITCFFVLGCIGKIIGSPYFDKLGLGLEKYFQEFSIVNIGRTVKVRRKYSFSLPQRFQGFIFELLSDLPEPHPQ